MSRFLKHVSCYSFNGWCDPFLQVLDIPYLLRIKMFLMYPHRKKLSGERSGLRGGQGAWIGRNGPIPWPPRSPELQKVHILKCT